MRLIRMACFWALTACSALGQTVLDESFPVDATIDIATVHRLVSADFLDPRSAQYKGMTFHTFDNGTGVICGWVNTRNETGGYGPFSPFFVETSGMRAEVRPDYHSSSNRIFVIGLFSLAGCSQRLGLER